MLLQQQDHTCCWEQQARDALHIVAVAARLHDGTTCTPGPHHIQQERSLLLSGLCDWYVCSIFQRLAQSCQVLAFAVVFCCFF
jgi:hypothetical protein